MAEQSWTCPDCAEQVVVGSLSCPYCGYGAAPAATAGWGYCPACQGSRWEGAAGRCATCGAFLTSATPPAREQVSDLSGPSVDASSSEAAPALVATGPDSEQQDGRPIPEAPIASSGADDEIVLLRELAGLRDEGIITSEEFERKKAEILRRL